MPYLSLFRALKTQADNFAHLCVLQLSAAAEAVQGSEEGVTHMPIHQLLSSPVREEHGLAQSADAHLMEQGFGRHRLGSSLSVGSNRFWEGEWLISGDKTKNIPKWSEQDFRGMRE